MNDKNIKINKNSEKIIKINNKHKINNLNNNNIINKDNIYT